MRLLRLCLASTVIFLAGAALGQAQEFGGTYEEEQVIFGGLEAHFGYAGLSDEGGFLISGGLPLLVRASGTPFVAGVRGVLNAQNFSYPTTLGKTNLDFNFAGGDLLLGFRQEGDVTTLGSLAVGVGRFQSKYSAPGVIFYDAKDSGAALHFAVGYRVYVIDNLYLGPEVAMYRGLDDDIDVVTVGAEGFLGLEF